MVKYGADARRCVPMRADAVDAVISHTGSRQLWCKVPETAVTYEPYFDLLNNFPYKSEEMIISALMRKTHLIHFKNLVGYKSVGFYASEN